MHNFVKGRALVVRSAGRITAGLMMVATLAGSAGAQQPAASTAWRAWLGCWSAASTSDASTPLVCVTPTSSADAVKISTVSNGKVVSSQTIDASGHEVPIDATGCTGNQTGRWSADGRRVYLSAVANCDGKPRTTTAIIAMTSDGEWLDVQGMKIEDVENVHVARYHDAGVTSAVPTDVADLIRDGGLAVSSARLAAGANIGTNAVVEAASATGVGVTEAFVLERGQHFSLDARQLIALSDAGVSPRLTDAMIAVSNPQAFAVKLPAPGARDTMDYSTGRRVYVTLDRYTTPFGWGYSQYGYSRYGNYYDPYGLELYRLGYGGYGYGFPGYTYGGPVIIVRGTEPAQPHGRLVKGHGYQPAGATSGTTQDRQSERSRAASSTPAPRTSGGTSSGSAPASSSSSERTAKPRP